MAGREPNNAAAPGKQFSKKRLLWFKTISILLPLLLLLLLEAVLRLSGYGYDPHLFISYPDDDGYMIMNPDASKKYFTDEASATTGNVELFRKEKTENTLRIFVLGESTTIGYPYFHNGSFHRWLQYRLMRSLPDKNIEIINCALTAVNSYTVRGFAKEVMHYQPDAVLIYTGHNEYYGALGVGSTGRIGSDPRVVNALIWLRSLKVGQVFVRGYNSIAAVFRNPDEKAGKRRMEVMAAEQHIAFGTTLFKEGLAQFKTNMDATLALFSEKKIPVFISNLVSNEKDLKPFVDMPVDRTRFPDFNKNYQLALKQYNTGSFNDAKKYFLTANQAYRAHAGCNFYLGKLALKAGELPQARAYFERALDLDALRFRAPNELNDIIVSLCSKYHRNTHYVDAKKRFEAWSQEHIIGDELILEHVHPNLLGYAILSDAFYEAMKLEEIFKLNGAPEIQFNTLLQEMPITEVDSLAGAYKIAALRNSWPFVDSQTSPVSHLPSPDTTATQEERFAHDLASHKLGWELAMDRLYDYYVARHRLDDAGKVVEALVLEHPTSIDYYKMAANIYGELNQKENAIFYFKKTFGMAPSGDIARYLFVLYFKLDRPEEALPYLDYAMANGGGQQLASLKKLAREIIGLKRSAEKNKSYYTQIAERYRKMGNKEGEMKYVNIINQLNLHYGRKQN